MMKLVSNTRTDQRLIYMDTCFQVVYIIAVSSMALAAHIKIINIEDLMKEQPFKTEYGDYDDIEFTLGLNDDDDYHFDSNGTFLSFNDDDSVMNDAAEITDDNEYNDGNSHENEEDVEEYDTSEDSLKPYGALNHVKEDLQPYGALNYKQHQYNQNIEHSAELFENSEEELLVLKRTTTPRPLREPRPSTDPFRLRLQRLFSNRKVVFLK